MSTTTFATNNNTVVFIVGNTYKRISNASAKTDRTGKYKKVHDWRLYLDVVGGDPDVIQHVQFDLHGSFQPNSFTCSSPVNIITPDGSRVCRFSTRQQSYGASPAPVTVRIVGRGGSWMSVKHTPSLKSGGSKSETKRFFESNLVKPFQFVELNKDTTFGIELELSCSTGMSMGSITETIRSRASVSVNYNTGSNRNSGWNLTHDGSIACSSNAPNCTTFELVSPILSGENGLTEVSRVLRSLQGLSCISVNKSMGFHVHVGVQGYGLSNLIKVCQNFVKYEDAIDTFMPQSRRTGSSESNRYCKSNKLAIGGRSGSNKDRHSILSSCQSISDLCEIMNPEGRYYKLNLRNLATSRQDTIEFRQHSGTSSFKKINAWIRFCVTFTFMSKKNVAPKCLKSSRGVDEQFDMLFEYVIKDRALKAFFVERRDRLRNGAADVFSCKICLEDDVMLYRGYRLSCNHCFCTVCLSNLIKSNPPNEVSNKIICPETNCSNILSISDIQQIFRDEPKSFQIYSNMLNIACIEGLVSNNGDMRRCPAERCNYIFVYDENSNCRHYDCPLCHAMYCLRCDANGGQVGPAHPNLSCLQQQEKLCQKEEERRRFEQWRVENAQADMKFKELFEKERSKGITRECPRCTRPITKNGGCDSMQCVCGHRYIWSLSR